MLALHCQYGPCGWGGPPDTGSSACGYSGGPRCPDRPARSLDPCCWRAYIHRFDVEHTLRCAKNTLGWTTPRVRRPEQGDRGTWLVGAAYTQLRLARGLLGQTHPGGGPAEGVLGEPE